jgi:hypothetical protein
MQGGRKIGAGMEFLLPSCKKVVSIIVSKYGVTVVEREGVKEDGEWEAHVGKGGWSWRAERLKTVEDGRRDSQQALELLLIEWRWLDR